MPHDTVTERLKQIWQRYQRNLAEQAVSPAQINKSLATELDDIRHEITPTDELRILKDEYNTPYNVSSDMELEGIVWPQVPRLATGSLASSSTGDTVLLTGVTNKIYVIQSINHVTLVGTTQEWMLKIENGSSFGTDVEISEAGTDGGRNGIAYPIFLDSKARMTLEVTNAVASSTIDWSISYLDFGFGTVWGQT